MDHLSAAWAEFFAWIKSVLGSLLDKAMESSLKSKAIVVVILSIAALWGFDRLPSLKETIPDYATGADVKSVQRSLEAIEGEIRQLRIEITAIEEKLSERPPAAKRK